MTATWTCHRCGRRGRPSGMWRSADPGLRQSGRSIECANREACDRRIIKKERRAERSQ